MKKKIIILAVIVILLILVIPIPFRLYDGGTIEYKALIYKVSKVHKLNSQSVLGYEEGTIIEIFGIEIYNDVIIETEVKVLEIEDILSDDIIFTIESSNKTCVPVQLVVKTDNIYLFYNSYKAPLDGVNANSILNYSDPISGAYNYEIIKIIQNSKYASDASFDMDNLPEYIIYTGKGTVFTTDRNNEYLKAFLESINISLDSCASKNQN